MVESPPTPCEATMLCRVREGKFIAPAAHCANKVAVFTKLVAQFRYQRIYVSIRNLHAWRIQAVEQQFAREHVAWLLDERRDESVFLRGQCDALPVFAGQPTHGSVVPQATGERSRCRGFD